MMNIEDSDLFKENFKELQEEIEKEYGPDKVDSNTIRKFLIARDGEVKQAYLMLKKNLEWRKQNHVDTILEDFQASEVFEKHLPCYWFGFDEDGPNVCLVCTGSMDIPGYLKSNTYKDCFQQLVYIIEKGRKENMGVERLKKPGKEDKSVFILDASGLQMSYLANRKIFEYVIQFCIIFEANYPEMLKTAYMINASAGFQLLFSIMKPFISRKTKQKVYVYGTDGYKEDLLKAISPKSLPACLGGEVTDPDGNLMCYSTAPRGGTIPKRLYLKDTTISGFKNQPGVQSSVIKRNSKFDLPLQITLGGSFIKWEFEVNNYDIEFGLFYKTSDAQEELLPLISLKRSNVHLPHESGSFECENPGIYVLTWNNTYSFFRSKVIYYKASVIDPDQV